MKNPKLNLIYDQENEMLTLMYKNSVVYSLKGEAAYLTFVSIEMGHHTQIWQKLAEGKSPALLHAVKLHHRDIQATEKKYE